MIINQKKKKKKKVKKLKKMKKKMKKVKILQKECFLIVKLIIAKVGI